MDLATLTIICCQTLLISQIRVRSQAVEEGEAVSDFDVDLVVHVLLHIALTLATIRIWSLRLLLLQGGRILWELPLGDDKLRLRRLSAGLGLRLQRHGAQEKQLAQSVCCYRPC